MSRNADTASERAHNAFDRPLRVYLDSSDYSTLSDSRKANHSLDKVRNDLLRFARSGEVEFRFSGAHICEISPLNMDSQAAAQARADLLADLCGTRALISPTCLIKRELLGHGASVTPYADNGDWFPEMALNFGPACVLEEVRAEVRKQLTSTDGLNRAQKRAKLREVEGRKLDKAVEKALHESRDMLMTRIMEQLPMRDEDAETMYNYVRGSAPPKAAEEAFLNGLRDPRWMTSWFAHLGHSMLPLTQSLRKPGEDIAALMSRLAKDVSGYEDKTGKHVALGRERFKAQLLTELPKHLSRMVLESQGLPPREIDPKNLHRSAPGFSAMLSTFVECALQSFSSSPRTPKRSDFLDAIHVTYTPYVDIFRADRFTASILKDTLSGNGVRSCSHITI